jgi:glycosyltransferase involved in cell wall biosynthesis
MLYKWGKSFNPNFHGSNWKPSSSSPDIRLHSESRNAIVLEAIEAVAQAVELNSFDSIIILLPAGISATESILKQFDNTHSEVFQHSGQSKILSPEVVNQVDMESWDCFEFLSERVPSGSATLIISALVTNSLMDVRPILRAIRKVLRKNSGNVFASINSLHKGNVASCHSLIFEETSFRESMIDAGFQPRTMRDLPQLSTLHEKLLHINFFGCSQEEYDLFLSQAQVKPKTKVLNITTESVALALTGGIGRYCEEFDKSHVPSLFLLALHGISAIKNENGGNLWVKLDDVAEGFQGSGIDYEGILQGTLQLIFIFDELEIIEFQDYLGIGYRISQANQVGLLPSSMRVHCVAHGNQFYIQSGFDHFGRSDPPETPVFERISAEYADKVVFATRFLEKMYVEQLGWKLKSSETRPYPNSFKELVTPQEIQPISKIAFLGKDTYFKGFDLFLGAIQNISSTHNLKELGIESVVILGTDSTPSELMYLEGVELFVERPNSQKLSEHIENLSSSTIFVLPYRGDNSPLLVQEVVQKGTRYLFGNAGGIPEVVPLEIAMNSLVDLNPKLIAQKILEEISISRTSTEPSRPNLSNYYDKQNSDFTTFFKNHSMVEQETGNQPLSPVSMGIIVTMFNPSYNEVLDCITGINNQISPPDEVIFVDDCSAEENFLEVTRLIQSHLLIRHRVIRHGSNKGLSASRNTGLRNVKQETLIALDIDDVIHPRYLLNLRKAFSLSGADIVTSGSKYFQEGFDFRKIYNFDHGAYFPNSESLALSLNGNTIGHACAGYRTAYLEKLAGWDESNRALWEDYQFFLRAALDGATFAMIPEAMLFYRIRVNSMVRTYRTFPGYLRLMSELTFLPSNHRFEFLSAVIASRRHQIPTPTNVPNQPNVQKMGIWIDLRRLLVSYSSEHLLIRAARVLYRLVTLKFVRR